MFIGEKMLNRNINNQLNKQNQDEDLKITCLRKSQDKKKINEMPVRENIEMEFCQQKQRKYSNNNNPQDKNYEH